jgi:hypothetical protein
VNKLSRVFVALAVSASTIVVPHALAQRTTPPPSDAKLMHDVEAVLQNEKAFRGLSIVPKTSRGIVTLTGSVSSEGDKVLAGLEVGNVDGVKTVINNLEVKASASTEGHLPALANPSGAQTQQLSTEARTYPTPAAAPGAPLERTITIPANTSIQVRISDPLTSKTAKANDHFHGTVATVVFADGALAIPVGTPVVGRVVSAKPAGHFIAEANMSLEITTLRLPLLDGKSRDVPVVTEYLTNNGQAHGSNVAPSGQIEVKPQTVLRFQTQAALTTSVWIKNGTQLQLPAAQDPILDSRPSSN